VLHIRHIQVSVNNIQCILRYIFPTMTDLYPKQGACEDMPLHHLLTLLSSSRGGQPEILSQSNRCSKNRYFVGSVMFRDDLAISTHVVNQLTLLKFLSDRKYNFIAKLRFYCVDSR